MPSYTQRLGESSIPTAINPVCYRAFINSLPYTLKYPSSRLPNTMETTIGSLRPALAPELLLVPDCPQYDALRLASLHAWGSPCAYQVCGGPYWGYGQ